VTAPLVCPPGGGVTSLSVHPSVEAPDAPPLPPACASASASTTTLCFSPPLGTFEVGGGVACCSVLSWGTVSGRAFRMQLPGP
jgi:hypothetical protein